MARVTFKDWKNTGGSQAFEKELLAVIKKRRNLFMVLGWVIPVIGPIVFGAMGIVCMDTVRELEGKSGNGFLAGLYRLCMRFGSFFIELIPEYIIANSVSLSEKVCGVYNMLNE